MFVVYPMDLSEVVILHVRIHHRAIAGTTLADQQGSVPEATDRKLPLT
jgi:hypothetical protein